MSRYVEVPSEALFERLNAIGQQIVESGGQAKRGREGYEVVYDLVHHQTHILIRIYTTITEGARVARDCGEDAIRVVVGTMATTHNSRGKTRFVPLVAPRKMLRTAPTDLAEEDRINAFLDRLVQATREAYAAAGRVPACPTCGRPMAERRNKRTSSKFYGCIFYPGCRGSRPLN